MDYEKKWLEKQGNKLQGKKALEAAKEEKVDNANKVESKFYKGEWLCENEPNNYARFIQILEIVNVQGKERYRISRDIHNDKDVVEFEFVENYYHKFDIKDTKDGDILTGKIDGDSYILIFKQVKDGWMETYGHYYDSVDRFCVPSQLFCRDYQGTFIPATKEQRDLLFAKMKEAGYAWDTDKKELMKIEQKPAWSEEDENNLTDTCVAIRKFYHGTNGAQELIDWLQSLKERETWKPSDKQIRALRWVLNNIPYNKHKEEISGLLDQIKDL